MSLKFSNTIKRLVPIENQFTVPSVVWHSLTGTIGHTGHTGPIGYGHTGPRGERGESYTGPRGERGESYTGPKGESIMGHTGPKGETEKDNWKITGNNFSSEDKEYYLGLLNDKTLNICTHGKNRIIIQPDGCLQLFGSRSPIMKNMIQMKINIKKLIVSGNSTTLIDITEFPGTNINSMAQLFPLEPLPPGIGIGYLRFYNKNDGVTSLELSFINCTNVNQTVDGNFNLFVTVML